MNNTEKSAEETVQKLIAEIDAETRKSLAKAKAESWKDNIFADYEEVQRKKWLQGR